MERRDPDFEVIMQKVLIVYQDVALQNEKRAAGLTPSSVITVSVDEQPGVEAIANSAPCSILAALDLQDGHITARVEDRHRSIEFIGLVGSGREISP